MSVNFTRALALSTALGAATLLGAHAIAQNAPPTAPQSAPAQPAPDASPRGPGAGLGAGMDQNNGRMGRRDGERGWRGEGERRGRMAQLSDQDREALMSARLAAAKAALTLTPEQEKLWAPVESAIREGLKQRQEQRARARKEGVAANPVDRMRRMGEMASARGAAMTRLADAAAPLYASLTDEQKRRLRLVHRMARGMGPGMGGGMMGFGMMGGDGPRMGTGSMGMGRGLGRDAGEWRGRGGYREHHHWRHHHRGDDERGSRGGDRRL